MDDEDDDFYDPADSVPVTHSSHNDQNATAVQPEDPDVDEEDEEEEEEDEDDFNIITEASADAPPPELSHPRHATLRQEAQRTPSADLSILSKSATPATPRPDAPTPAPATAAASKPTAPQKAGSEYAAIHTSTIDVDGNPVHPSTGKPIMATDMDADFPADDKPWRRPGTDTSDYFNYGFDEFTWVSYCLKQQEMRKDVGNQKRQMDDMQSFLGMGMPPMPSAPAGPTPGPPAPMAAMAGVPDMSADMMQGMLASMMSQGLDPSNMDPMSFMQHAQAMMGQPGGGQQAQPGFGGQGQGQVQGFGQGGQGQMGYGGNGGYDQRGNYGGRGRGRRW